MKNKIKVKKGLTTPKGSKTKMVTLVMVAFGWSVPFLRWDNIGQTAPGLSLLSLIHYVPC